MNFVLRSLPEPGISENFIAGAVKVLRSIASNNVVRWGESAESAAFQNRKEEMRQLLQAQTTSAAALQQVQRIVGWERILLSLYLDDHGQPWLPSFEEPLAKAMIGEPGQSMTSTRRRVLTRLYFKHFDQIPCLDFVTRRLREAYAPQKNQRSEGDIETFERHRDKIFHRNSASFITAAADLDETLEHLISRFKLPQEGHLVERVRQVYLLEGLKKCTFGAEPACLTEIVASKAQRASTDLLVGAAALEILVERVRVEGKEKWPEHWQKWIVELGCDPRLGRASPEMSKWWGWATDSQLALATRGVIGLSLKLFFEFLSGTVSVDQWRERRLFLEELFDSGIIIDAKLLLHEACVRRLSRNLRDSKSVTSLTSTTSNTCVIVLKCVDDIFLIEGTHNFALRAFHRVFPIREFWERQHKSISDSQIRIPQNNCPIYVRHHGDWVNTFKYELRNKFHVEWRHAQRSNFTSPSNTAVSPPNPIKPMTMDQDVKDLKVAVSPANPIKSMNVDQGVDYLKLAGAPPNPINTINIEQYARAWKPAGPPPNPTKPVAPGQTLAGPSLPHSRPELAKPEIVVKGYIYALRRAQKSATYVDPKEKVFQLLIQQGKILDALHFSWGGRDFLALKCVNQVTLLDASHYSHLRCLIDFSVAWNELIKLKGEAAQRRFDRVNSDFIVSTHDKNFFARDLKKNLSKHGVTWNLTSS